MSTHKQFPILWVSIFLYVLGMGSIFYFFSDWTARQTWAVLLTGVVIIWYTWETMQLRYAAHEQRETSIRPYVILDSRSGKFHVLNVGNGTALNIQIDPVDIDRESNVQIRFPTPIPVLKADETAAVTVHSYKNQKDTGDFFIPHLDPKYATLVLNVTVHYQNIELKPYSVVQQISPTKHLIVKEPSI